MEPDINIFLDIYSHSINIHKSRVGESTAHKRLYKRVVLLSTHVLTDSMSNGGITL